MTYGLILIVHILVALFLIAVILLQGGRGGLGETMGGAAAQSLFGGGANTVMTKLTAVVASLFMVTCLSLAILSTKQNTSVVDRLPASVNQLPAALPPPTEPGHPAELGGRGSPGAEGGGADRPASLQPSASSPQQSQSSTAPK